MKIIFLLCWLLPILGIAASQEKIARVDYQELCLKERDPIKRYNYCRLMSEPRSIIPSVFQKERAIV